MKEWFLWRLLEAQPRDVSGQSPWSTGVTLLAEHPHASLLHHPRCHPEEVVVVEVRGAGGMLVSICTSSQCDFAGRSAWKVTSCAVLGFHFSIAHLGFGCIGSVYFGFPIPVNPRGICHFCKDQTKVSQGAISNVGHAQVLFCFGGIKLSHLHHCHAFFNLTPLLSL